MPRLLRLVVLALLVATTPPAASAADVFDRVRDRFVDHDGVRIHYVTLGRGPLIVMIHGFPDFWYGWHQQIGGLARHYQVAALDQRGYNLSDKPAGVASYDMALLAGDVAAVIQDLGRDRAIVVGHDWGGGVAWTFAMLYPALLDRLIVLQTPHPRGLLRELRTNPAQQVASGYARGFQQDGAEAGFTAEGLAGLAQDPVDRARYVAAFAQSDFTAMLNYYRQNYPREPYADIALPKIAAPVLVIHGLADPFLLAAGHNDTWSWVDGPVTLQMVPGVGHFIQQEQPALVTRAIKRWLAGTAPR